MVDQGYARSTSDHYMYIKKFDTDDFIILLVYVNNILIVRRDKSKIEKLKEFNKSFYIKDLGSTRKILGMKIARDQKTRCLCISLHEREVTRSLSLGWRGEILGWSPAQCRPTRRPIPLHVGVGLQRNLDSEFDCDLEKKFEKDLET